MTEQPKSIEQNDNQKLNEDTKQTLENKSKIDESTGNKGKKKKLFNRIFKAKTKPKKTAEPANYIEENKENKILYSYLCIKIDKIKGKLFNLNELHTIVIVDFHFCRSYIFFKR